MNIITSAEINRAFVHSGIACFAQATLTKIPHIFEHLEEQASITSLLNINNMQWHAAAEHLAQHAPQLPGPFGQLLRDYQLQLHEWFVLALCGETEASHLLNLALTELHDSPRPSLHLIEALTQHLFGSKLAPLDLPTHRLVHAGILDIQGDGPLPMRTLQMRPELWSLLCGNSTPWHGARALIPNRVMLPQRLTQELPLLASQLQQGQSRVLLFRANPQAGLAAAAQLAATLGLLAVEVETDTWQQHPAFATACHYGSWLPVVTLKLGPGDHFVPRREQLQQTPLVLICGPDGSVDAPDVLEIPLPSLSRQERLHAWHNVLGADIPEQEQALVDGPTIHALAKNIRLHSTRHNEVPNAQHLRQARAQFGSERLRLLAQPVIRHVDAEGLILPPDIQTQFNELILRCQRRELLWQGLGASLSDPSPGVRALFVGESGAGKTLAASRLATVMGAPLFRVDLAAVMNKYIGESEKNLGRVLDEAAALDAILLMDEADSLFGRRSEGKEGGERYANMLTNFLLTRIESHPGIVLLTSNSRNRIDSAFSRRFDTIIEFPMPGVEERYRLWLSHLGKRAPDAQTCRLLASYSDLPGGHIRNVVLNAAALNPDTTLMAADLLNALRAEYRKLGKTLPVQLEHLAS